MNMLDSQGINETKITSKHFKSYVFKIIELISLHL